MAASSIGPGGLDALLVLADDLRAMLGRDAVRVKQPLAGLTALKVGGSADLLVVVQSLAALRDVACRAWRYDVPWRVLGGGTNVLVSDLGYRGLVVVNKARGASFGEAQVTAASGALLSSLASKSVARGLEGLEWAAGIPGTVGGAVVGNAGAWGGDVASSLRSASVLEPNGVVSEWSAERFAYGYRTSSIKQGAVPSQRAVVLEASFCVRRAERQTLEARMAEIRSQRRRTQPSGATCGSVFKNPPGDYAGRLIDASGLRGHCCGAAQISNLHANFVINRGGATAAEVKSLIDLAAKTVQARFGTTLELEVELLGDW